MKLTKVKSTFTPPSQMWGELGGSVMVRSVGRLCSHLDTLRYLLSFPQLTKTNHTSKFLHVSGF